jgi:hypothetical protein
MRVKVVSILVCFAVCLSFVPALLPPLAGLVQASPMETLEFSFGAPTTLQQGNWRPFTLSSGEKLVQFTRPDLIVGTNASGALYTVGTNSHPVSGDLSGSSIVDSNMVNLTWDGLPAGTGKGYSINTLTFDDGYGNTFSAIAVIDLDFTSSAPYPSGTGRVFSTSGTGTFYGKKLIGTLSVSGSNGGGTANLRCYSASEISSPQAFSGTGTIENSGGCALGTSTGPLSYDEFVQFTGANEIFPKDCLAWYGAGPTMDGSVTGALTGTQSQSLNGCAIFSGEPIGPSTVVGGWNVGKFNYSGSDGTISFVLVADSSGGACMFAIKEAATGAYAGRDYYATATGETTGDPNNPTGHSFSGSLYTLTEGTAVLTATGTGTSAFVSESGSIENLTAVPESEMPEEGKPDIPFPHGFFEFEITGLNPGDSVTLTITLPSPVPVTTQYWKYGPTPSDPSPHWYVVPMGDNDGDNVITITLIDGGLGDDDLLANGTIIDQGGPGWPFPPAGGGGSGVPVFPSIYIGVGAALGAGVLAYFLRRRLAA